jgi:hypothetical protein
MLGANNCEGHDRNCNLYDKGTDSKLDSRLNILNRMLYLAWNFTGIKHIAADRKMLKFGSANNSLFSAARGLSYGHHTHMSMEWGKSPL